MTIPHTSGTITLTQNSALIAGTLTGWQTAGIQGGIIYPEAPNGNPLPLLTVTSETDATAAVKWKGATGTYSYALVKDTAYLKTIDAIHTKLLEVSLDLDTASVGALASLAASMTADKFAYTTGLNTMAWSVLSAFSRETLALGDAATWRNKIGAFSAAGGTVSGGITAPAMTLSGAAGAYKVFRLATGGVARVDIALSDEAESGGNFGSNVQVNTFGDGGGFLATAIGIDRRTGRVHFPSTPAVCCSFGADYTMTAGQTYGVLGSMLYNKGGFTAGGQVNGRAALHVPQTGWYRITCSVNAAGVAGAASNIEILFNGSFTVGNLGILGNWTVQTNTFLAFLTANDWLGFRCNVANTTLSGWNSRVTMEWIAP